MKVFSTGQVAKICKVTPRQVSKWFDSGRLKGYRIPGCKDWRIPKEYLIRFLQEHGMPLGELEDEVLAKVLVVTQDRPMLEAMEREWQSDCFSKVVSAASGFEAGIQVVGFRPDAVVVDFSIGRSEALQICNNLRRNAQFENAIVICVLPEPEEAVNFDRTIINEVWRKPLDAPLLAERLRAVIEAKKEMW